MYFTCEFDGFVYYIFVLDFVSSHRLVGKRSITDDMVLRQVFFGCSVQDIFCGDYLFNVQFNFLFSLKGAFSRGGNICRRFYTCNSLNSASCSWFVTFYNSGITMV